MGEFDSVVTELRGEERRGEERRKKPVRKSAAAMASAQDNRSGLP